MGLKIYYSVECVLIKGVCPGYCCCYYFLFTHTSLGAKTNSGNMQHIDMLKINVALHTKLRTMQPHALVVTLHQPRGGTRALRRCSTCAASRKECCVSGAAVAGL